MRHDCGRLGFAPHPVSSNDGFWAPDDADDADDASASDTDWEPSYSSSSSSSGSYGGTSLVNFIFSVILYGGLLYVGACAFARFDAGNLCQMSKQYSFNCERAALPLSAWILEGIDPMPPGYAKVDGVRVRLQQD